MSDDEAPKDVPSPEPSTPPVAGQYPPNWGSAYPPPPGGQYPPNYGSAYPPPPGSQYPPGYAPGYPVAPKHPQATTALVLGILGLVLCGLIGPFAWVIGSKAVKEIDANPTAFSGRSEANAGKIMGIVGTVLLGLMIAFIGLLVVGLAATRSSSFEYSVMGAF